MSYLDEKGIREAFAKHLMKHRGYSEEEAALAVSDFPDPYNLPYLCEEYIGEETIDGVEYEKCASMTAFWRCGMSGMPEFRFYTYYAIKDIPNHFVQEYMAAKKLYQIDSLNENDFPTEDDIEFEASRTVFI